jgi:hypothetical protein
MGILFFFWWSLWKEMNRRIFDNLEASIPHLTTLLKEEISWYARAQSTRGLWVNSFPPECCFLLLCLWVVYPWCLVFNFVAFGHVAFNYVELLPGYIGGVSAAVLVCNCTSPAWSRCLSPLQLYRSRPPWFLFMCCVPVRLWNAFSGGDDQGDLGDKSAHPKPFKAVSLFSLALRCPSFFCPGMPSLVLVILRLYLAFSS